MGLSGSGGRPNTRSWEVTGAINSNAKVKHSINVLEFINPRVEFDALLQHFVGLELELEDMLLFSERSLFED